MEALQQIHNLLTPLRPKKDEPVKVLAGCDIDSPQLDQEIEESPLITEASQLAESAGTDLITYIHANQDKVARLCFPGELVNWVKPENLSNDATAYAADIVLVVSELAKQALESESNSPLQKYLNTLQSKLTTKVLEPMFTKVRTLYDQGFKGKMPDWRLGNFTANIIDLVARKLRDSGEIARPIVTKVSELIERAGLLIPVD